MDLKPGRCLPPLWTGLWYSTCQWQHTCNHGSMMEMEKPLVLESGDSDFEFRLEMKNKTLKVASVPNFPSLRIQILKSATSRPEQWFVLVIEGLKAKNIVVYCFCASIRWLAVLTPSRIGGSTRPGRGHNYHGKGAQPCFKWHWHVHTAWPHASKRWWSLMITGSPIALIEFKPRVNRNVSHHRNENTVTCYMCSSLVQ